MKPGSGIAGAARFAQHIERLETNTGPAALSKRNEEISNPESIEVEARVRRWVSEAVIGLRLCPFARSLDLESDLEVIVSRDESEGAILQRLEQTLEQLGSNGHPETALLVLESALDDFLDFNHFLGEVEDLLDHGSWGGEFQVASFHPDYQFAGSRPEDVENLTNQAPYPILHILREESVSRALDTWPDAGTEVPEKNMETLRKLTPSQIADIWPWVKQPPRR